MKNKKATNAILAVMGVLIIVEIVVRLMIIQKDTVVGIAQVISLVFTGLYGFFLYKKPHGNMLKYAMLIFALTNIFSSCLCLLEGNTYQIAKVLGVAAVCYCAGRLDKINQNKYIMPVIAVVFIVVSVIVARQRFMNNTATFMNVFRAFNFTINYITLMIAYFVRFREHKEAGLLDKKAEKMMG